MLKYDVKNRRWEVMWLPVRCVLFLIMTVLYVSNCHSFIVERNCKLPNPSSSSDIMSHVKNMIGTCFVMLGLCHACVISKTVLNE